MIGRPLLADTATFIFLIC